MADEKNILTKSTGNDLTESVNDIFNRLDGDEQKALLMKVLEAKVDLQGKADQSGLAMQEMSELLHQISSVKKDISLKAEGTLKTGSGEIKITVKKRGKFF